MLLTLLVQFKLVYRLFGQNNMYSTLDFSLRPGNQEGSKCTTTKEKLRAYCPNV